jgi:HK97 family phage portal protein
MASTIPKPGLVDKLAGVVSRIFNKPLISYSTPFIVKGLPIYPSVNAIRYVNEGYCGNGTIYTIVSTASRKFGYIPRYVYKVTDKNAERQLKALIQQKVYKRKDVVALQKKAYNEQVVDNKFSELLARPNSMEGQDAFYEKIMTYFMTCGEAFIWLNRGDMTDALGQPLDDDAANKLPIQEMFVMPSQYMKIVGDPDDVWGVLGYIFDQNGKDIPIRKYDIIHWKRSNPKFDAYYRTHMRGLSPLEPGNKLVTQDESATDASVAMQQNDGAKAVMFEKSMSTKMDSVQKSQLEGVINRKVNNRDVKGAVAAIQGDWGMLDLSMSSVDMQLLESQENIFTRLCNMFGVNPMMFLANATYQNINEARKDLITGLILPCAASLRDEMNRVLLPAFGLDKSYTHDVDVSNLAELQEDMTQKVTQLAAAWWLTPNQKLEEMNEDKSDDPNMDKVWVQNTLTLMDDAAMTDTLNSFTDASGKAKPNSGGNLPDSLSGGPGKGNNQGLSQSKNLKEEYAGDAD